MKVFIVILASLFISVNSNNDETLKCGRFLVDAVIRQIFELLRQLIKTGSIDNNVPVLDPLEKDYLEIVIADDKFRIRAELFDFALSGLGDFELMDTNFDRDEISLELNLLIPTLTIVSDYYNMTGDLYSILPLRGNGYLHIEAHNLIFRSKIYLKQSADGKSILIRKLLRTHFEVDKILTTTWTLLSNYIFPEKTKQIGDGKALILLTNPVNPRSSQTEFDGNVDDILNKMVEDLLADYLSRFSKFIAAQHEEYGVQYLNQYISHFESWRLIAAIL